MDANPYTDNEMNKFQHSQHQWVPPSLAKCFAIGLLLIVVAAACKPSPALDTITISTATPSLSGSSGPTSTPEPQVPYPISGIPHCQGLQDLGYVLKFEWPDIENALEKLADYNWGYYSCGVSQSDLKTLIQTKMPQPPYLWQEIAWVEHGESTGSLFYHYVYRSYIYMWMLTPPDRKNSYLVIAKGDPGVAQTWDCRLLFPSLNPIACLDCRRNVQ